jgi:drug/metabolite transporter (DMT)-like permease
MAPRIKSAFAILSAARLNSYKRRGPPRPTCFWQPRIENSAGPHTLRLDASPLQTRDNQYLDDEEDTAPLIEEPQKKSDPVSEASPAEISEIASDISPVSIVNTLTEEAPLSSIFLLNLVAVIWGTQHAVTKMVVDDSEASLFTLLRFSLAALIASPYTPGLSSLFRQDVDSEPVDADEVKNVWRWGAEMGIWMFLGFAFQATGLASTTAQRSGFLLYLNVKFVPFFARVLLGREISIPTWVSAATAFTGTALLALDGNSIGFNVGDAWSIAAAMSSAMFILRLEFASKQVSDSAQLNAACLWVVALLAGIWSFTQGALDSSGILTTVDQLKDIAVTHPLELIYLGGVTTALANYIQTKAQKDVSAERASVIYSMDPVYGAAFSWLLLGETLGGPQALFGVSLITLAAVTNAFVDFGGNKTEGKSQQ